MSVPPGSGWPGDLATARTPVAADAEAVGALAAGCATLTTLAARVTVCRACPRLVAWRESVAEQKRAAFATQPYWGRPIAGFGDPAARIFVLGLAPAAHGGNRTGRTFTGDRSGDWLFGALYRAGLANQAMSVSAGDGLQLRGTYIAAAVRCAPPANKPTPAERDSCRPWLVRELELMWSQLRSLVVLGGFGWAALWPALRATGAGVPRRIVPFAHGAEVEVDGRTVIGCYHVSQQNTFTRRLTEPMLDAVFGRAALLAGR